MSVSDKNYAVCLCTEQGFFPLYVWTHYKCLSSDFFIITVCHWCYTCKISFVLTCRILCIGHLTSTWSSQSSLGRVCRNHWQTTDDCAYWVKSKSAQFFISSFSFAWTRVSNKNDVPVIQLKYTLYKKSRTKWGWEILESYSNSSNLPRAKMKLCKHGKVSIALISDVA